MRRLQGERVLFHYNGHGVPRPTANGEVWVFNKSYTQYIPLSIYDLQVCVALLLACCIPGCVLGRGQRAVHVVGGLAVHPLASHAGVWAPAGGGTTRCTACWHPLPSHQAKGPAVVLPALFTGWLNLCIAQGARRRQWWQGPRP